MAGRPGRSGGWNRLPPEVHQLRGTKPRLVRPIRPVPAHPGPVPATLLEGLGTRGAAFIEAAWAEGGEWPPDALVLLREVGILIDRVEAQRGQRDERSTQRLLLTTLAALQGRREARRPPVAPNPAPSASKWDGDLP